MALVVKDRIKETSSTTGTGTLTLGGAVDGFRTFADIGNSNTTYYCIEDGSNFEIGIGTYTASGTTLSRDTVLQTSAGNTNKISCTGNQKVFVTQPAGRAVYGNAASNIDLDGRFLTTSITNGDVNIAANGTGIIKLDNDVYINGDRITFEGTSENFNETILVVTNPTANDRTITFPDATGTVALTSDLSSYAALSGATFSGTVNIGTTGSLSNNSGTFLIDANTNLNFRGGTQTFDNADGSVEYMRLNSTGLGIGISPAYKFHQHESSSGENYHLFTNSTTGQGSSDGFRIGIDSNENALMWHREANSILFATSNDQKMEIDSSGRVGIGITPDTSSTGKILQINRSVINDDDNGFVHFTQNAYYNNAWKYVENGTAEKMSFASGTIRFDNASSNSGGADASLTWSERMRVDSSGNFLVAKQTSDGANTGFEARATGQVMATIASATNEAVTYITQTGGGGNNNVDQGLVVSVEGTNLATGSGNILRCAGTNSTHGAQANAFVVKNSGNVGIGTNAPSDKLVVYGDGARMTVNSNDYEVAMLGRRGSSGSALDRGYLRLRKDGVTNDGVVLDTAGNSWFNGGNVGIGTSSPARKFDVEGSTNDDWISRIYNTNTNGAGLLVRTDTTSANDKIALGIYADSAYQMVVRSTGKVGIGTITPEYITHIEGPNVSSGGGTATICITDDGTAYNGTNPGGGITFRGKYNSSGSTTNFGTIQAVKANTTDGDYASDLIFTTRSNGGNLTEAMRIDNANRIILNNGSPIKWGGSGSLGYIYGGSSGDTVIGSYDDIYLNSNWVRFFNASNGSSGTTEYARIAHDGNWISGPLGVNGQSSNYDSSGQVLTSNGNASPSWQTPSSGGYSANFTGYANAFSVGTSSTGGQGELRATGNIIAYYSDERLKDFHGKIENAVDKVKQLNGYYFSENDKAKEYGYKNQDKKQIGVSAQEVEKVLPEIVSQAPFDMAEDGTSKSGEDYKTVDYEKLVPLLIEAIKEQQIQIDCLKEQLNGIN